MQLDVPPVPKVRTKKSYLVYFVSFVALFEIVISLFVYIVKRYKSVFSSSSSHSPFGNHTKTDIFPHNNQITFSTAVQQTGASYLLAVDMKPILFLEPSLELVIDYSVSLTEIYY